MEVCPLTFSPEQPYVQEDTQQHERKGGERYKRKLSDSALSRSEAPKKPKQSDPQEDNTLEPEIHVTEPVELVEDVNVKPPRQVISLLSSEESEDEYFEVIERPKQPVQGAGLEKDLDDITVALVTFEIVAATKVITAFNQKYHLNRYIDESPVGCGDALIKPLVQRLYSVLDDRTSEANVFKSEGCFLLGILSRNGSLRVLILQEGGLDYILAQVKRSRSCLTTLRYCCYALGNLCASLTDDYAGNLYEFIENDGVVPFLFDAVREYSHDWQFAQQVFFCIGNLAYLGELENICLENNGVQLAVEFMQLHNDQVLMVTDAVFFLKNLAYDELGRELIILNQGIVFTLEVLWINRKNSELVELAMNLFFDLSFSGAGELLTRTPEPVRFFLSLLEEHRDSIPTLKELARTLLRLYSISNSEVKRMMLQEGLVDAILKLRPRHEDKLLTKQLDNGCQILLRDMPLHEEILTTKVPSLMDIAGRAVLANKIPYKAVDGFPEDLTSYLDGSHRCEFCNAPYFTPVATYVSRVPIVGIPTTSQIPKFWRLCSKTCLAKLKEGKDPMNYPYLYHYDVDLQPVLTASLDWRG